MRPGLFVFLLLITSNVMAAKTQLIVGVWKSVDMVWIFRPDGTALRLMPNGSENKISQGIWTKNSKKSNEFIVKWKDSWNSINGLRVSKSKEQLSAYDAKGSGWNAEFLRDSYPPIEREVKKKPVKKHPARQKKTKVRIPRDAVKYKGHYYKVFDIQGPQSVATEKAESLGGHLVRIKSPSQQQFISQLATRGQLMKYWIDGSDALNEGIWLSSDGEQMRFIAWEKNSQEPSNHHGWEHHIAIQRVANWQWNDLASGDREPGFICEWDTVNRGAKVEDAVEEQHEPEEEKLQPFSLDDEQEEEPLKPFSFDDDPVEEEADLPPPTDPEGILDRAGLYEGRRGVWYLKRANNFATRVYERLSSSSEIRSAIRAVNGRLPTEAEMNNPPSRR